MRKIFVTSIMALTLVFYLTTAVFASERTIIAPNGPDDSTPLSPGVATVNLVFTSGQLGFDASGKLAKDIKEQTRLALESAAAVLKAGGSDISKAVKTTVYLKNMSDFAAMNEVYAGFFKNGYPARSTVEVSKLALDALVEIEIIAVK